MGVRRPADAGAARGAGAGGRNANDARRAVQLGPDTPERRPRLDDLAADADSARGSIPKMLAFAVRAAGTLPTPGTGSTALLWEQLATIAAVDLTVARAVEPHVDALAILAQAGDVELAGVNAGPTSTWGVFAAEAPDLQLTATPDGGAWVLDGTKPWCSLARDLSHAIVTANTDGGRRAFAVDLRHPGVVCEPAHWAAHGLARIHSGPVSFTGVPAVPVGAENWYLERPGFAWGGAGIAAVWWGASVSIGRKLWEGTRRRTPDQIALMHLGAVDTALESARAALLEAAGRIDAGSAAGESGAILAYRVRAVVAAVAETVLDRAAHAMGPAPLTRDTDHADRVVDLQVYLRQHHAERDDAALGSALLRAGGRPW